MTPDEWAEDRRVIDAATDGPWVAMGREVYADWEANAIMEQVGDAFDAPDADFAARARTRWSAALDRIAELEAKVDQLRSRAVELLDRAHAAEARALLMMAERDQARHRPSPPVTTVTACSCIGHFMPGVKDLVACCGQPHVDQRGAANAAGGEGA